MKDDSPLQFFATLPHACSYLENREAVTLFVDPRAAMSPALYGRLAEIGFRRSGAEVYRPMCEGCDACVPVRIPVQDFRERRGDRRILKCNADLEVIPRNTEFRNEHYDLYCRYIATRHAGGGMDNPTPEGYLQFLRAAWCDTQFVEFRSEGRLLAVAVTDVLPSGLSAVYTFFEPGEEKRSLGTFAILWQIREARRRDMSWLYLGYWIEDCDKMRYKGRFRPLQAYRDGAWETLT